MRIIERLAGPLGFVAVGCAAALAGTWVFERARGFINRKRKRPARGIFFTIGFTAYAVALLIWLAAGLAAAVVRSSPGAHRSLHEQSNDTARVDVDAREYSFDQPQLTVPAGRPLTVAFRNYHKGVTHNFAIYERADNGKGGDDEDLVVGSRGYKGPAIREFTFAPLRAGYYTFQCDVQDPDPEIGNHSRFMYGFLSVEEARPVAYRTDFVTTAKRGLAHAFHYSELPGAVGLDYIFSFLAFGLGVYLVARRRMDRVARLFGIGMLGTAAAYNIQSHAALDVVPLIGSRLHPFIVHFVSGIAYVYAVILFPDGKLVPSFRRLVPRTLYRVAVFIGILMSVLAAGLSEPAPGQGHAVAFVVAFGILVPGVGLAAQGYRFVRAQSAEARQRSKILLWAFVPALILGIAVFVFRSLTSSGTFTGPAEIELDTLAFRVFQPVFIMIPVAIIVGILRYRMWDLDVVINKAILYGTLAAFIGAVYVGVVTVFGSAIQASNNPVLALVATVIAASAFGPLRTRVQRLANRLVYGPRATPYEALAAFSKTLAESFPAEDVLSRMAEAAARGVGGAAGVVTILLSDGKTRSSVWPVSEVSQEIERTIGVFHRGERIGEIGVAKQPGDPITARDTRILEGLAAQAGVALEGVRLTEQLQQRLEILSEQAKDLALSRNRIVTAADAAQQEIQQEIAERVERELVAIKTSASRARESGSNAAEAAQLLGELVADANRALESLRSIAHGIFPPLLGDKGVKAALESELRKMDVAVDASIDMSEARLHPEVEAALYFCCMEALRIAAAEGTTLEIGHREAWVEFRVASPSAPERASLERAVVRMTDRAEALGGDIKVVLDDRAVELSGRIPPDTDRALAQVR